MTWLHNTKATLAGTNLALVKNEVSGWFGIHPRKLTCPLKRDYFTREYIFQPLIFRGHIRFQGIQPKWRFYVFFGCWTKKGCRRDEDYDSDDGDDADYYTDDEDENENDDEDEDEDEDDDSS